MRLGFAVKVLGDGGQPSHDARRWQSGPHLSVSLEHLEAILRRLDRVDPTAFEAFLRETAAGLPGYVMLEPRARTLRCCGCGSSSRRGGRVRRCGTRGSSNAWLKCSHSSCR